MAKNEMVRRERDDGDMLDLSEKTRHGQFGADEDAVSGGVTQRVAHVIAASGQRDRGGRDLGQSDGAETRFDEMVLARQRKPSLGSIRRTAEGCLGERTVWHARARHRCRGAGRWYRWQGGA